MQPCLTSSNSELTWRLMFLVLMKKFWVAQTQIFLLNTNKNCIVIYNLLFLFQILWTALSVALGIEIRGEYIRGVPCIKTYGQLFCPTAGTSYPL